MKTYLAHCWRILRAYRAAWRWAPIAHGHRHQRDAARCEWCLNVIPFWARCNVWDEEAGEPVTPLELDHA